MQRTRALHHRDRTRKPTSTIGTPRRRNRGLALIVRGGAAGTAGVGCALDHVGCGGGVGAGDGADEALGVGVGEEEGYCC